MQKATFPLSEGSIRHFLGDRVPPLDIRTFDLIDSTNTEAKRMVREGGPVPLLIAAAEQSSGRGRMGRSFYSPGETGAYFSILYRPSVQIDSAVTVTCAASVAVLRAIRVLTGRTCGIKWVNDLYLDGRKVCGILTEGISIGSDAYVIVGIGINLSTSFENTELASLAGSLGVGGITPAQMIAEVTAELLPLLNSPEDRSWLADYRRYSNVLGCRISFFEKGTAREGIAEMIDGDGALCVRVESGELIRLFSGEISVKMQ